MQLQSTLVPTRRQRAVSAPVVAPPPHRCSRNGHCSCSRCSGRRDGGWWKPCHSTPTSPTRREATRTRRSSLPPDVCTDPHGTHAQLAPDCVVGQAASATSAAPTVTARGGSHLGAACSDGAARLRPLSAGATQKPQERFSRRWGLAQAGPTPALCSHDQGCAFSQIGTRRVAPRVCVFSHSGTRVATKFVSTKRWNRRYAGNGSHQCQTLGQTAQYRRFGRGLMCTVDSTPLNSDAQGTPSLRIRVGQRGQGTRTSAARRGSVVAAASISQKHRRLVAR